MGTHGYKETKIWIIFEGKGIQQRLQIHMLKLAEKDFKATIITMHNIAKENIFIINKKAGKYDRVT